MICFRQAGACFNYRVAAVVLCESRVLLQTTAQETYWTLPGGRVELGEPSNSALAREMREELDVEISIDRLLWCVENFFTYDGTPHHEIELIWLAHLPSPVTEPSTFVRTPRHENVELIFEWFEFERLTELDVRPAFLQEGLPAIPDHVSHIVQDT